MPSGHMDGTANVDVFGSPDRITKADYIKIQRQSIIDSNWKSANGNNNNLHVSADILYHGSREGIKGDIRPISHDLCDFGRGFYCGDLKEQAELLVKDNGTMKLVYTVGFDPTGLKIYTFDDTRDLISWSLYIAVKRQKIDASKYTKLSNLVQDIDSNDVIIGLIADDEMFDAFNAFLANSITDLGLAYCLSKVQLGHQYVFKTDKACKQIIYKDIRYLSRDERQALQCFHDKIVQDKLGVVDYASNNIFDGKRLGQILKEFK